MAARPSLSLKKVKNSMTTIVGGKEVVVKKFEKPAIVHFKDKLNGTGPFCFWTAVFKVKSEGKKKLMGRARVGLSAGDRFDRMEKESIASYIPIEDRLVYRKMWRMMGKGKNLAYIRPSNRSEVKKWMKEHPEHAKTVSKK